MAQHGQQKASSEAVKNAIDVLYKGADPSKKDEASRWLENFQHSVNAWEISSQLLNSNSDTETSYFAAQTMRTKVQFHFAELSIDIHNNLKDSLLQQLKDLQKGSKATITQLCLALADLATQSPQWSDPVADLASRLSSSIDELPILLEILTYLPEEIESRHLKLGANRREEFLGLLKRSSETVLHLLLHCQNTFPNDEKVQCKIYQCFGSWMELGSFPPEQIAKSDLLKSVFQILISPDTTTTLHDAVTDCLCSALYISEDITHQQALAESCFNFTITLPHAYEKAVREEDLERAINFARIFTEMAVSLLNHLLNTPGQGPGSFETVDMLISFLDHPEFEVGEITFRFWYRFSETLYNNYPDDVLDVFRPYVQKLIMKLCVKCQLDLTQEGVPGSSDDLQEFRYRVLELVQDTVFIVGYSTCFVQIMKGLSKESSHWNETEASMFIMQSIANKVPQRQNSYVGDVVVLIINLPVNSHIALKHTALRLLAKVCPWINENKDHIDTVFHFILNGLQDKQLATASAIAFEHFCEECCQSLTLHFQVILQVVDALDSLSLTPNAISGILKGAASVLSCLPYEQITEGLTKLCIPQVRHLTEILHNSKSQEYKAQKGRNDPVLPVDRLATIFRHTSPVVMAGKNHPCQTVVEELWPHLSGIAEKYKHSERIMERICRCLRFAIRCVGTGFGNLLQPFVEQMINIYYHYQHSCLLYLGSILVDEYGQDPNCAQGFIEMLKAYCGPTFTILSAQDGLQNRPDTVDDFFRLCIRLLQKCPVQFLENESMEAVMQLAVAAIALNHREANSSVVKFLVDLTGCARNDPVSCKYF
eukprot:gene13002-14340_t